GKAGGKGDDGGEEGVTAKIVSCKIYRSEAGEKAMEYEAMHGPQVEGLEPVTVGKSKSSSSSSSSSKVGKKLGGDEAADGDVVSSDEGDDEKANSEDSEEAEEQGPTPAQEE
ncbi:unnamed protein product, partial [Amoebophrya sp. A25]